MIWRDIPGYEGLYQVSDGGDVRSVDREVSDPRGFVRQIKGRGLSVAVSKAGYQSVSLWRDGKGRWARVHQLVAWAFIGPQKRGIDVRHKNDNKQDNRLENLEYGDRMANAQDMVRNGKHHYARRDYCKHGHRYTKGNYAMRKGRGRQCLVCQRAANKAYRERSSK